MRIILLWRIPKNSIKIKDKLKFFNKTFITTSVLFSLFLFYIMAGAVGFEPTHNDTKNRCLTAWRHPKIPKNNLSILKFNCQEKL